MSWRQDRDQFSVSSRRRIIKTEVIPARFGDVEDEYQMLSIPENPAANGFTNQSLHSEEDNTIEWKTLAHINSPLTSINGTHGWQAPQDDRKGTPASTIAFLSSLAKKWTMAEVAYYQQQHKIGYSPLIPRKTGIKPPIQHLEDACREYERRYTHNPTLEGQHLQHEQEHQEIVTALYDESPYLLVATNVKDHWKLPASFKNRLGAKFMLVPGETEDASTLFINCLAGKVHGMLESAVSGAVFNWVYMNGLETFVAAPGDAGEVYQPDRALSPRFPDHNDEEGDKDDNQGGYPYPRLVIEVEHTHRNGRKLRIVGFSAMKSEYTRLFLGVKVWPKTTKGTFAAAAVLWGRDDENQITVRKAFDFGTKRLDTRSKLLFGIQCDSQDILPAVTEWTRPQQSPGYNSLQQELDSIDRNSMLLTTRSINSDSDWCLTLPAKDLLYKTTSCPRATEDVPYILDEPLAITDCHINLRFLAWIANMYLDDQ